MFLLNLGIIFTCETLMRISQDVRHFSAQVVFLIPVHFLWPFTLSIPAAAALGSAGCRCVTDPERQTCGMPGSRLRIAVCFLVLSQPAQPALLLLTKRELGLVAQPASCSLEQELCPSLEVLAICRVKQKAGAAQSPEPPAAHLGVNPGASAGAGGILSYSSTVKIHFYCF